MGFSFFLRSISWCVFRAFFSRGMCGCYRGYPFTAMPSVVRTFLCSTEHMELFWSYVRRKFCYWRPKTDFTSPAQGKMQSPRFSFQREIDLTEWAPAVSLLSYRNYLKRKNLRKTVYVPENRIHKTYAVLWRSTNWLFEFASRVDQIIYSIL